MGTRNLTMVIDQQGETKVAQYGQWDGYPSGQGLTILNFLSKTNKEKFKKRISKMRWMTKEEADAVDKEAEKLSDLEWEIKYPYLSRNTGGDILELITDGEITINTGFGEKRILKGVEVKFLSDNTSFAADSLFCEYAYVIDLQKNTFEIYEGFQKEPLTPEDRFFALTETVERRADDQYYPVKLVKTYSLDALPTEQEFLDALEQKEEAE